MSQKMLEAALAYASSGFYVFPVWHASGGICACGAPDASSPDHPRAKHPIAALCPNGKDDATRDPGTIRAWFKNAPHANLGIETAKSGLITLDVDVAGSKQGRESLAEIDSELPSTLTALTGSGGLHAYYRQPNDLAPFSRIGVRPGIDLIGNGYVIAPPSIHVSGKPYIWLTTFEIAPLPKVLRDLRRAHIERVPLVEIGHTPIPEGGRNNALFKLGAALRSTAIGHDAIRASLHLENLRRFQPPLPYAEVDQIAVKVMRHARVDKDVATGAAVEDELALLLGKPQSAPSLWIRDVAAVQTPPVKFYSTGNVQLDAQLGGGISSAMVTGIVGPPSAGKSSFVTTLTIELQRQVPVLSISTELTRPDLMKRTASVVRGWVWRDAIKGKYDGQYLDAVRDLTIKLVGTDELDTLDPLGFIVREALQVFEETGHKPAIMLDYVQQLARGGDNGDARRNHVGELTMKLRKVSQILDVPIVAVFATSREFYNTDREHKLRTGNDPTAYLAAAKESGDVEYDCGNMIYLDVDKLHVGQPKPARAVVARARMGEPGFVGYRAHLDIGRWLPDALAAPEIVTTVAARQIRQAKDTVVSDDALVKSAVTRNPGKPWSFYRDICGIPQARATSAKIRMLHSGELVEPAVETWDENHRKHVMRQLTVGPATSSPAGNNPSASNV